MKRLESMVSFFEKIAAGILFVTAVYIPIFYGWDLELHADILWQILFLAAVCALGSIIIPLEGGREVSRNSMLIRTILYFAYVNAAVLGCGFWYGWFSFHNGWQVMGMELAIIFVYAAVYLVCYFSQSQEAKRMNEKLKERE
ncbi:MAG: DUF3021 domain-containing protein [Lachnospiraceae bacterium]|nr:DUF3021 domain-containing protein [Lachnospiraceae bacterium]